MWGNRGRDWPTLEGMYGRAAEAQPAMGGVSRRSRRGGLVWAAGGRRQELEETRQMLDVNPTAGRQNRLLTSKSRPPWIGFFLMGPDVRIQICHGHAAFPMKIYNPFDVLVQNKFVGAGGG